MKNRIRVSALALMIGVFGSNVYASSFTEDNLSHETPRKLKVYKLNDQDRVNSASFAMASQKDNLPENKRRILSCDGGGMRGLYEIAMLAVLEEIILYNDSNKRISDYFDVAGGTSTGSIIAAGLFFESSTGKKYSAIDLLKIYARYGYEIFDDYKTTGIGLLRPKYGNEGVDKLLTHHFGDGYFKNTVKDQNNQPKNLYVVGFDATEQKPAVFSTKPLTDPEERQFNYHLRSLKEAIGISTAAPVFFPSREITKGTKNAQMKDGGLVANNPTNLIFQEENLNIEANYELYSFGTGAMPIETGAHNTGITGVGTLIEDVFGAQTSAAERNCAAAVQNPDAKVSYFARLQPFLDADKGGMDDTSDGYVKYALKKAFDVTRGDTFSNMVSQLGLDMKGNIEDMIENVRKKLFSLSADTFEGLDMLEKRWLVQEISKLNFDLFQNVNANGNILSDCQTEKLLEDAIAHIQIENQESSMFSKISNLFFMSETNKIPELIPRALEFHELSKGIQSIRPNGLVSDKYITLVNTEFKALCDTGKNYKYPKHNSSFVDVVAQVYWKNKFRDFEDEITYDEAQELFNHLTTWINDHNGDKAYTSRWIGSGWYQSRGNTLVTALGKYINKKFPENK